jgi:hypothetical protein
VTIPIRILQILVSDDDEYVLAVGKFDWTYIQQKKKRKNDRLTDERPSVCLLFAKYAKRNEFRRAGNFLLFAEVCIVVVQVGVVRKRLKLTMTRRLVSALIRHASFTSKKSLSSSLVLSLASPELLGRLHCTSRNSTDGPSSMSISLCFPRKGTCLFVASTSGC